MKSVVRPLPLILILLLLFSLTACRKSAAPETSAAPTAEPTAEPTSAPSGPPSPLTRYAGTYEAYSVYTQGRYVLWEQMAGNSVELRDDGTGWLDWGEGNSGPISEWSTKGDGIVIMAGVSVMDARCDGKVLYIDLGDGMELCFVAPDADTSAMPIVGKEALGSDSGRTSAPIAGVYYPYAMESGGICVRSPEFGAEADGSITIREDGTLVMLTGEIEAVYTWRAENGELILTDALGNPSSDLMTVTVPENGVFTLEYRGQGLKTYYAAMDADTSSIEAMSLEEYQALQK